VAMMEDCTSSNLLMWKSPLLTGVVLSCFNLICFFIFFLDFAVVPFFANVGMLAIFFGAAIKFAAPSFSEREFDVMSKDTIHAAVESIAKAFNIATEKAKNVVLWTSEKSTVKALVALELVRRLAPWISVSFLAFLSFNLLFILPYILEAKKEVIEKSIEPHIKMAVALKDKYLALVPKYTDVPGLKED
jgi:hypothetical protein